MKILVLSTASFTDVERAVARVRKRYPESVVVIGVTEVERAEHEKSGLPTLVLGEQRLQLEASTVRNTLASQGFELFVIPLGGPRQSLLFVARFVRFIGRDCFVVDAPLVRCLTRWPLVWLVLVVYSLFLGLPLIMAVRFGMLMDGLILLAGQLLARSLHLYRGARRLSASGPVCHVIASLGTGGAQRQLIEYLRRSRLNRDQLRLLVLFKSNDFFIADLRETGIISELIAGAGSRTWLQETIDRAFPMSTSLWLLQRHLRSLQPSCVYSWLFATNVIAAPAARLAGVPRVMSSVRNLSIWKTWPEYRRWWMRLADRLSAPLNDVIVANSQAVVSDYARWAAIGSEKMRVIINGIDVEAMLARPYTDMRSTLGLAAEVPILLTIGRLTREKNYAMLLRACARVRDHGLGFRLLVVGHGELEPELRLLCAALHLTEQVHFTGKTDQPESFYRAADLFVLSSNIEGMPNVVIEAQAFAVPVVTTCCGGSAEVVVDGKTGLVVDIGDEEALAAAIIKLLEDPARRAEMGRCGQERMSSELGIERMTAAIDGLCSEARL
jgi:glycosyltransferase involved in cell wall biosynthesis